MNNSSVSGSPATSPPAVASPAVTVARAYWPTRGWRRAQPEDQGVDAAAVAQIEEHVAAAYPQVRSVLVVRHGYLVYERYWRGIDRSDGHDVRSVTKSVVATLVGIAVAEGKVKSLDQTVSELLAAQLPENADSRFARVTVRHLLTMTSGLAGDDESLGGDSQLMESLGASTDWVRHILSRRLTAEPGERFAYSSASSHLLSAIIANTTGQSTLSYARAKLFDPLGIDTARALEPVARADIDPAVLKAYHESSVAWPVDRQGYHLGGLGLRLRAGDLAKLGYLHLNGGRWEARQLVPADYVSAATSPAGSSPNLTQGYGWHWWVGAEEGHNAFFARGYGGQFIHVVPDLDLVTVVTSEPDVGGLNPETLISRSVIPAVGT